MMAFINLIFPLEDIVKDCILKEVVCEFSLAICLCLYFNDTEKLSDTYMK